MQIFKALPFTADRRVTYWFAAVFFIVTMLIGGGSRTDILSLVILRPLAIIFLMLAIAGSDLAELRRNPLLAVSLVGLLLWGLIQLIPLPPGLWHALPGREVIKNADAALGLEELWRPISMMPNQTLNAVFALTVPIAMLFLLLRFPVKDLGRFLAIVIAMGLLSAVLGVFQSVGEAGGMFHFYRITNPEFPVGLYANRNHQAFLLCCMFPLLAAYAALPREGRDGDRYRLVLPAVLGVAMMPLILVTGSRLALLLAALGIASAAWIYLPALDTARLRSRITPRSAMLVAGGVLALVLILVAIVYTRETVFVRMSEEAKDPLADLRFSVWPVITEIVWKMQPVGSGLGTFADVYKIYEPDQLLQPEYLNHAHNDWLELPLTAGIPGVAVLVAGVVAFVRALYTSVFSHASRSQAVLNRMGASIVVILALASFFDYPLRVPSMACIFIFAAVCLRARAELASAPSQSENNPN